jgi:DNA repair exonuclease SbcCD nuclease subunit
MSTKQSYHILCTGDLHLGRFPSRVPASSRDLSVSSVWEATIEYAIAQAVDAVALTGDVVDRDNRFFESYGPLRRGLDRLAKHDIDTFAVSGNHDYQVFPHLVDALEARRFHLLGRGGTWGTASLDIDGKEAVRFVGWSFPASHVRRSPVDDLDLDASDVPVVGLVHADLDKDDSSYAPVTRASLASQPVDAWLLGHIHKPKLLNGSSPLILYPGSPQPLDPGEEGVHGPWRLEITAQGQVTAHQVELASVHYETLSVDLSDVRDPSAFKSAVVKTVEAAGKAQAERDTLKHIVCRLQCTGRTPIHRKVDEYAEAVIGQDFPVAKGATATIDGVEVATRPDVNLEEVAQRSDPPGMLAQMLLELQRGDDEHTELVQKTRRELEVINQKNKYASLRRAEAGSGSEAGSASHPGHGSQTDTAGARKLLVRQGLKLLDALLAQKDGASNA